jgi:hypothetical protein
VDSAAQERCAQAPEFRNPSAGNGVAAVWRLQFECILWQKDRLTAEIKQDNRSIQLL